MISLPIREAPLFRGCCPSAKAKRTLREECPFANWTPELANGPIDIKIPWFADEKWREEVGQMGFNANSMFSLFASPSLLIHIMDKIWFYQFFFEVRIIRIALFKGLYYIPTLGDGDTSKNITSISFKSSTTREQILFSSFFDNWSSIIDSLENSQR